MKGSLRELAKTQAREETKAPKWWERLQKIGGEDVKVNPETLKELDETKKEFRLKSRSDTIYMLIWYYRNPTKHPKLMSRRRWKRPELPTEPAVVETIRRWMTRTLIPSEQRIAYQQVGLEIWGICLRYRGKAAIIEYDALKKKWTDQGLDEKLINQLTGFILTRKYKVK